MARNPSQATVSEFNELKKFYAHWETHLNPSPFFPIDHPLNPVNVLAAFESQFGVSKALSGLKQAVGDVLESVPDYAPAFVAQADASLAAAGAATLTQLWLRRSARFGRLLRRGDLRDDVEYRLISSILSDTESALPAQDREILNDMMVRYESKRA